MRFFRKRTKRALGLRRGTRAQRAPLAALLGADTSVDGHADLSEHATPVADQGVVSSCVAHGVPGAVCTTLSAAGCPLGYVPSVRHLYQICLRMDRASDYPLVETGDLPALRDQGTRISTCVQALSRYGTVSGGSNCESSREATSDSALVLAEVVRARRALIVGGYSIATLADAALALERGRSLAIGGWWDSRSFDLGPSSRPMRAQNFDDPLGGGHCVELLGYDARGTERVWTIKNSWGTGWGRGGFMLVTDDFLRQQWDLWILDVVRRP